MLALQALYYLRQFRLSVRPSVTRRYCVKTTARSTVQFALSDSKMCLVEGLRRYKAKPVKTRCLQEGVGHLEPRFQGEVVAPLPIY